jgi:hypothetical protein
MPGFSKWSLSFRFPHQNPVCSALLPHTCNMPRPSHSSWFHQPALDSASSAHVNTVTVWVLQKTGKLSASWADFPKDLRSAVIALTAVNSITNRVFWLASPVQWCVQCGTEHSVTSTTHPVHRATGPNCYTNMLLIVPQTINTHSFNNSFIHSFTFIQDVPKIHGQTKRVSSSNENEEKC